MPLLSPSAKKKQQKIGGVPLDLARAVLGAVFDTLDETRTGSLEVAELQRVGFKTATMVGSPSDAQVDREAFVRTIVSLLGRKNADDSAKLLPEAVALCGRVFRLRAAAAARDAADLARAEAEEKADVASTALNRVLSFASFAHGSLSINTLALFQSASLLHGVKVVARVGA